MTSTQDGTEPTDQPYDVVVVGGGVAGLSGALVLGRSRRSVLVVDAGEPRNAPAAHTHGFLTRDGTPPGELLDLGRAEVRGSGAEIRTDKAVSAAALAGGGFTVQLGNGDAVRARRLLITTGLVDELPDVAGVRERWGRDVIHCPYCHGWEVRDQAIAVLATGALAMHQTLMFRQLTEDLTLFLHTAPEPTGAQFEQLSARGINVVYGEVAGMVVTDDRLTGVRMASGEVLAAQVLVVGPRIAARDGVLASLGVAAGDMVLDEAFWEEMYRSRGAAWSGRPNPQLVTEAADLTPGTALDVGSGEGADAVWLAERGWQVTGVDISSTALQRAQARAAETGPDVAGRITWRRADLLGKAVSADRTYDLVTAHFMQVPSAQRQALHRRLAAAVSPGGTLLVVGHHPSDLEAGVGRFPMRDLMFTAEQVAEVLPSEHWEVVVCEDRPRVGTDDEGVARTVHDAILNARRRV